MMTTGAQTAIDEPSRTSELIVALPHQNLVVAALRALGNDARVVDESLDLGLALLKLTGPDSDRVALGKLYDHFEDQHDGAGWAPTMGRNRVVKSVVGAGEISCGDNGQPQKIESPTRWPVLRSGAGRGVRVCVLDTAVDGTDRPGSGWVDKHSDLLRPAVGDRHVSDGHSTFITGLILSQAPGATVEVRQVLGPDGSADSWSVAKAIARCGREGFDVLNLSFACRTTDGKPPLALATAIGRVVPRTVVVAAAGNHGPEGYPAWPAAHDGVVAVGAIEDDDGVVAQFTPPDVPWIDVYARGMDLASTFVSGQVAVPPTDPLQSREDFKSMKFNGFARWSGTSFAAALVSGAIAAGTHPGSTSAQASYERLLTRLREPATRKSPSSGRPGVRNLGLDLLD